MESNLVFIDKHYWQACSSVKEMRYSGNSVELGYSEIFQEKHFCCFVLMLVINTCLSFLSVLCSDCNQSFLAMQRLSLGQNTLLLQVQVVPRFSMITEIKRN